MAQGQLEAYKMEYHVVPTVEELSDEGFLPTEAVCPDGTAIDIRDGQVIAVREGVGDMVGNGIE